MIQEYIDKKWLILLLYQPLYKIKGLTEAQLAAVFSIHPLAASITGIMNDYQACTQIEKTSEFPFLDVKSRLIEPPQLDSFIAGLKCDIHALLNAVVYDPSTALPRGCKQN